MSQASLSIAEDDELLQAMKTSGCQIVLIGFESLNNANLDQMNKSWNYKLGERDVLVRKIHKAGIGIYASFVFGFDYDSNEIFDQTFAFAMKHKFFFVAFNHLLPFPGTPIYKRFQNENRLLYDKWWLKEDYKYGDIPYLSKKISPKDLRDSCFKIRRKFFTSLNILRRGLASIWRNTNLLLTIIFFTQNRALGKQVPNEIGLPIGGGDEAEKQ